MKKHNVACPICGTFNNYQILYPQNYRDRDFTVEVFSARRLPDKIHYQLVSCLRCGLVRSTPVISNDELNHLYQDSKLTYDREVNNLTETYVSALKIILNKLEKKAVILEIGCGNGFVLQALEKKGYKNVFGVEPSKDAVEKSGKLKSRIVQSFFKKNLFKRETFDLIFIFQTLDHIPNPTEFLDECYRVLKSGGYIFAYNHNVDSFTAKIMGEKSPIFDIEHTFLYNLKTIRTIFENSNFNVLSVIEPWNTLSLKHLIWLLPLPKKIKKVLLAQNSSLFHLNFKIPLGNLAITAQKS